MKIHGFFGGVGSTIGQLWCTNFRFQVDVSSDYSLPNWVSGNPASPTLLDISGDASLQSSTSRISRIMIGKFQESSTQFGEISILFMIFFMIFQVSGRCSLPIRSKHSPSAGTVAAPSAALAAAASSANVRASDQETKHASGDMSHWIGLRENLQETMVFTIKYRVFL